jgi:long-chain acyl-CoA synthetase
LAIYRSLFLLKYRPQRVNQMAVVALGGAVGFFSGDPLRLLEDAQVLKPNFFPSVPRILNRIYQAAMVAGNVPGLKGAIFRRAVQTKLYNLRTTGVVTHPLWDRLVFRKVRWCSVSLCDRVWTLWDRFRPFWEAT